MPVNIPLLQANSSGFARGTLPRFLGVHRLAVKIRGRFKNYCYEEESDIQIYDNSDGYPVTNTMPIRTGKKYVFSGKIVTVNSEEYPNVYDNRILVFYGKRYWIEMDPSL